MSLFGNNSIPEKTHEANSVSQSRAHESNSASQGSAQKFSFCGIDLDSPFFMAPMAGVTDSAFRTLCHREGCGLSYTEMVSAKGLYYKSENTNDLLRITDSEGPVAIQLFGSEPDMLAFAARALEDRPNVLIDINMGCPVPKVVKNGEGSALLNNPKLAASIVRAAADATKKPVTVKTRIGFDSDDYDIVTFAKMMEDSGAAAITIHGRTRSQYYSGNANWDRIKDVRCAVKIPVVANGDIFSRGDADKILDYTGCEFAMIARGALGNPWIFSGRRPSKDELIEAVTFHMDELIRLKGEYHAAQEMRRHVSFYTKGIRGAAKYRGALNSVNTRAEMLNLLKEI